MGQIVQELIHIKVRGFDDLFKVFHKELAAHADKFSRPQDVLLENVRLASGHVLTVEIFKENEYGVDILTRLISSLQIVRDLESLLETETDFTYSPLTPNDELTAIIEQEMRENHLSDIVPLVTVCAEAVAR